MDRILKMVFLMMLIGIVGTAQAQTIYSCDFEDGDDVNEWTSVVMYDVNNWAIGSATAADGNKSMYISNDGGRSYECSGGCDNEGDRDDFTFAVIYHTFNITESGRYILRYDWKCALDDYDDFMRAFVMPNTIAMPTTPPDYIRDYTPDGWTTADRGYYMSEQANWNKITVEMDLEVGTYNLAYMFQTGFYTPTADPAAIDNVEIIKETCPKMTDLFAYDIKMDGFTLGWGANDIHTSWNIEYGPAGFEQGSSEGTAIRDIDTIGYVVRGLSSSGIYDIYGWGNCGEDTSLMLKVKGVTACSYVDLPYYEDFSNVEQGTVPNCWTRRNGLVGVDKAYGYGDVEKYLCCSNQAIIASPKMPVPYSGLSIQFQASGKGAIEVGYVTDLITWDYHSIDRASIVESYLDVNYYVPFNAEEMPDSCYIVFSQYGKESNKEINIDKLKIDALNTTHIPYNFTINQMNSKIVNVSWECNVEGADYEISYGLKSDHEVGGDIDVIKTVQNAKETVLDYTDIPVSQWNDPYEILIRSIYNGDTSDWIYCGCIGLYKVEKPRDIYAIQVDQTTYDVLWSAPMWGVADKYLLKYGIEYSHYYETMTISNGNTSCRLSNLRRDEIYDVKVATIVGNDTSDFINCKCKASAVDVNKYTNYRNDWYFDSPFGSEYHVIEALYPGYLVENLDTIREIGFYTKSTYDFVENRNVDIYLGYTDMIVFFDKTNFISSDDLTLVYSGIIPFNNENTWKSVTLNAPIAVEQGKNIVLLVYDHTGSGCPMYNYLNYGSSISISLEGLVDHIGYPWEPSYFVRDVANLSPDIDFSGSTNTSSYRYPRIKSKKPQANSLTYEWTQSGSENSWVVRYRRLGDSVWVYSSAPTSSQTYTINNLVPGCRYEVGIGSIAGSDTLYTSTVDYTLKGVYDIPYMDDLYHPNGNECWHFSDFDQYNNFPNEIKIKKNKYVVLPEFNEPLNELQLSIEISSAEGDMVVGISQESQFLSDYVVMDTIDCVSNGYSNIKVVSLEDYAGSDGYIVIQAMAGDIMIDSVCVDRIATCSTPQEVKIVDWGKDYIHVTWKDDSAIASWEVTLVSEDGNDTVITVQEPNATFDNLMPNTFYTIYVKTNCGNEMSSAIPVTCTTLTCNPYSVPFACDFMDGDMNSNWTFISGEASTHWMIGSLSVTGDSLMYITDSTNRDNVYDTSSVSSIGIAYLPIKIESDGYYGFQFGWQCMGVYYYDKGRAALIPSSFDFTKLTIFDFGGYKLPAEWIAIDNYEMLNLSQWRTTSSVVNVKEGMYYLTFIWTNSTSNISNPPLSVDDIFINKINCSDPINVQVRNISDTSAFIIWEDLSHNIDSWNVIIQNQDPITVTEPYCFVDNLNPSTGYEVKVNSNCSSENQSNGVMDKFFTECGEIMSLPYINTFAYDESGEFPHCWYMGDDAYDTRVGFGNLKQLIYSDHLSFFSLQRINESVDLSKGKIVFDAVSPVEVIVEVGMCDIPSNLSTFTPLKTVTVGATEERYQISLQDYTGSGRYVTFKIHTNVADIYKYDYVYMKMDNVGIDVYTPCELSINPRIELTTWNSITMSWEANENQTSWTTVIISEDSSYMDTVIVNVPTVTFSDLQQGTRYSLKVRSICSELEEPLWSTTLYTTTDCGVATNVRADNITSTSARISWTPSPDQQNWEVIYGPQGFYPTGLDTAKNIKTIEHEVVLIDLIPETMYDVHVKSNCNEISYSISLPVTFKTTDNGDHPEGIDGIDGDYQFMIYPNPTSGTTTIKLNGITGEIEISIIDMTGRIIKIETINCGGDCEKRMDVEGLAQGTYFVRVVGNNINSVRKLIVR